MYLVVKINPDTHIMVEALCSFSAKEHAIQYVIEHFGENALNNTHAIRYIQHYH